MLFAIFAVSDDELIRLNEAFDRLQRRLRHFQDARERLVGHLQTSLRLEEHQRQQVLSSWTIATAAPCV